MAAVQSSIRDKVSQGEFPAPTGTEAYSAYAIASGRGLILEMESAARQTLDHPMTFKILGEGLQLFEGWALQDLANFPSVIVTISCRASNHFSILKNRISISGLLVLLIITVHSDAIQAQVHIRDQICPCPTRIGPYRLG